MLDPLLQHRPEPSETVKTTLAISSHKTMKAGAVLCRSGAKEREMGVDKKARKPLLGKPGSTKWHRESNHVGTEYSML